MTHAAYTILGITDERDACDCCGRQNLKRTVALQPTEGGEPVFFGTTCAARALKWTVKDVKAAAKSADDARYEAEREAREALRRAEDAKWDAFLLANAGPGERFHQIERLGGYGAARDLYRSGEAK